MGDKDFFLSTDDAQTMGDIEYMRTPKRTRRTFPKTLKNKDGFAIENEVSATEDRSGMYKEAQPINNNEVTFSNSSYNYQPAPAPAPAPAPEPAPAAEKKKTDTGMDMFRNMAKNIRR